jgi:hypothetical protein
MISYTTNSQLGSNLTYKGGSESKNNNASPLHYRRKMNADDVIMMATNGSKITMAP